MISTLSDSIETLNIKSYVAKGQGALKYFACFVAFGFGTGLLQAIPGTLATLLIGVPLHQFLVTSNRLFYVISLVSSVLLGIWACGIAEHVLNSPDDPAIVWDEICGYLITMAMTPEGFLWSTLAFILFRLYDILKPWPINYFEKNVSGGLGIMLDDILAAIYAGFTMRLLQTVF